MDDVPLDPRGKLLAYRNSLASLTILEVAYAFAEGRGGVSAEFIEDVEPELNKLAPSLELFADAVESNGKVLDQVDQDVITGITKVMFCCCQTLQDLGILVTSPRSSPLLRRYGSQGFKYYQGGRGGPGNTEMFRDMLRIHVEAIDLTTKTLQRYIYANIFLYLVRLYLAR